MKKKFLIICAIVSLFTLAGIFSQVDKAYAANRVWEPEHRLASGTVIQGHWRAAKNRVLPGLPGDKMEPPGLRILETVRDRPGWKDLGQGALEERKMA